MDSAAASPAATATDLFRPCVEALWPNGEPALVLTFEGESGTSRCAVVDLRHVQDPATGLWQFICWTTPTYIRDLVHAGALPLPYIEQDPGSAARMRRKVQSGFKLPTGQVSHVETMVWDEHHPFLVLEIDYLLCKQGDTPEMKACQRQVIAQALQESRFPFTALIDSGGKSVHAVIRLADSVPAIMQAREPNGLHDRLQEALWVAFGNFDVGVFDQGGKWKLVRAPGALRDGTTPQTVLAVNPEPVTYQRLLQWAEAQMFPEVAAELAGRPPCRRPEMQPWRLREGFKEAVRGPWVKGGRGTRWFQVVKEMTVSGNIGLAAAAGAASFLWWFAALATHQLSEGWFFSDRAEDQDTQKERRYTFAEARQFKAEKEEWEQQHGRPPEVKALAAAATEASKLATTLTPPEVVVSKGKGGGNKDSMVSRHPELIQMFQERLYPQGTLRRLLTENGGWWMKFNGQYWQEYSEDLIEKDILKVMGPCCSVKNMRDLYMHLSRLVCLLDDEWPEAEDGIVFKNGTLYFTAEDGETAEFCWMENHFDIHDYITTFIPRNFDPSAKCPNFMGWLGEVQADPDVRLVLQELTGIVFVPDNRFNVFILHTGDGANGKSTYLRTLKNVLGGKANWASINLGKLDEPFSLGYNYSKLLLYDDEVGKSSFKPGSNPGDVLKKISGNEPVELQKKYGALHSELMHGTIVLNCNQKPHWATSPDSGFWRRIMIIPWDTSLEGREIAAYYKRFLKELDGILVWAMQGLQRVMSRQGAQSDKTWKRGFTKAARLVQEIEDFQAESDPIKMFAQSYLSKTEDHSWYSLTGVWNAYKDYCQENDIPLLHTNYHHFARRLHMLKGSFSWVEVGRPRAKNPENRPLDVPPLTDPEARYGHAYRGFTCTHPAFKRPIPTHVAARPQPVQACMPPPLRVVVGGQA